MRARSFALALLLPTMLAAAPRRKATMVQATLDASVRFGPGREPPPGTPPFQPILEGTLTFAAPAPKGLKLLMWLVPTESVAGMKSPSATKGARRLAHSETASDNVTALRAEWPLGHSEEAWQLAVEFRVNGLFRGHAVSKVKALFLPSAPPRGGRNQEG